MSDISLIHSNRNYYFVCRMKISDYVRLCIAILVIFSTEASVKFGACDVSNKRRGTANFNNRALFARYYSTTNYIGSNSERG